MIVDNFNLLPLLAPLFLALTGMGLLIVGAYRGNEATGVISASVIAALCIAFAFVLATPHTAQPVLSGMFIFDGFAAVTTLMILSGLVIAVALSHGTLAQDNIARFEYPILVLFAGLGMIVMVSAHNMMALYIGLELQSLSLYVLAAFKRGTVKSAEAGVKYFILGALSSGMLLFGMSLLYGFTGTLDFDVMRSVIGNFGALPLGVMTGMAFLLAGMAFKISAVPFHMWTPDVYQGAPTTVTALFAIVPKVAAFGLLMRLLFGPFADIMAAWQQVLYFLCFASMTVAAFAAIAQKNVKRLLAYSSIGHMGYALIGLVIGTQAGAGAVLLYLLIYMIMSAGVFAVVLSLRRDGMALENIEDMKGLSATHPGLCYALAILMFSMSGIPPMAGFFGKLIVFQAAIESGFYILATVGVLSSVVAAYYYLRIIKVMFFEEAPDHAPAGPHDFAVPFLRQAVLAGSLVFVLGFIVKPSFITGGMLGAVASLFAG